MGIITGSGSHGLAELRNARPEYVATPYGEVEVSTGRLSDSDVLHISRHGEGHMRLSGHVNHRANVWALKQLGATAVIGCTACGAVDPALTLGSLVVFDDLHFISNRLADGRLCTFFDEPGDPRRAHWVLHGGPYSAAVRQALTGAASAAGHAVRDSGVYGHVDGPRFNTPAEIAGLAAAGVSAVSQTGGPETVLCGELELPYALIGFVTDFANEVRPGAPTLVAELTRLMGVSRGVFASVLRGAAAILASDTAAPAGTLLRMGPS